jgi:predicted DCC family thiol-disulfide oxidoreductase YuxK
MRQGWTDEEMWHHYLFDLQTRYALGLEQIGDAHFDLRTVYNFRERLSRTMQETGINLLDQVFAQVTDEQIEAYQIKTGRQRMDSTQVASNIRQMGRIQLLVTVLQRVPRMLSEEDREHYAETLAPYTQGHAGQYVYRLKGEEIGDHLQRIGTLMQQLLDELKPAYEDEPIYQVLERVFDEHFQMVEEAVRCKSNDQLSASSLQSPDDLEATYRNKRGQGYQGYTANITETCDPDNELQLITKVQVAPNNVDDTQLLDEALPELKERTDLDTLYTDGGYGSPEADDALRENNVEQIQTAIRGRKPSAEKLHLSDFEIKQTDEGKPTQITCPQGQTVNVRSSNQRKSFVAHFAQETCQTCPFSKACPARPGKRDPRHRLRFTQAQANVAQRRRRSQIHQEEGRNLRAAVEATVRQVKHPFPGGKLPVRGQFRVTCMILGSAIMGNIRRIQQYKTKKTEPINKETSKKGAEGTQASSFCLFFSGFIRSLSNFFGVQTWVFGC